MFNTCHLSFQSKAHFGDRHVTDIPGYPPAPDTGAHFSRRGQRSKVIGGATSNHFVRQRAKLAEDTALSAGIAVAGLWLGTRSNSPNGNGLLACPYWSCRADDAPLDGRIPNRPIWTYCQQLRERGLPMPLKPLCAGCKQAIGAGYPAYLQSDFSRLCHG